MKPSWPYTWRDFFSNDYRVPKAILDLVTRGEAEDVTNGNDSCPRFARTVAGDTVDIFSDHPDPNQREFGPEATRYFVTVNGDVVYAGDASARAIAVFRGAVSARLTRKPRSRR